jgi:hypothetical protein
VIVIEQHRERDAAHRPGAAGDAPADVVLDAPIAKGALRLAGDRGSLSDGEAFLDGEGDQSVQRRVLGSHSLIKAGQVERWN